MTNTEAVSEKEPSMKPDRAAIEDFLYFEAGLIDDGLYDAWEALWAEDGIYWVPIHENGDPESELSIIYDNRERLRIRIERLKSGGSVDARSAVGSLALVSNIVVESVSEENQEVRTCSAFLVSEMRRGVLTMWAGRCRHVLRWDPHGNTTIVRKTVVLLNRREPLPNLAIPI